MQCTNCGRQLSDQAISNGFCPSCGMPIAAQTTPAAPPVVATTSVPAPVAALAPTPVVPAVAAVAASESAPTTPIMPKATPIAMATPAPTSGGNRTGLIVGLGIPALVVIVLIILFFLGKGGTGPFAAFLVAATAVPTATAAATSTPAPTAIPTVAVPAPATGFTTFQAPDGTYGVNYPTGWLPTAQSLQGVSAEAFISTDFQNIFLVAPTTQTIPPSQYVTLATSLTQPLGVKNITVTGKPTTQTLGTTTWNKVTGTLVFNGTPYTATILGVDRTLGTFVVAYLAPTASYKTAETTDFIPMATSVSFGA